MFARVDERKGLYRGVRYQISNEKRLFFMVLNAKIAVERDGSAIESCEVLMIESHGVRIKFELGAACERSKIIDRLHRILPGCFREIAETEALRVFKLSKNSNGSYNVAENGIEIVSRLPEAAMFDLLDNRVRLTVAEHAVGKVFLHAGVVAWNGRAIVVPAKSFCGKTTLVAELVKNGAIYYSDEYAIVDEAGLIHPFPKMLSMRGIVDDYQQTDVAVEDFGGVAGTEPISCGMILFTQFRRNARWQPKTISPGTAMIELLAHALPIRNKPEFTLKVLNNMMNRVIITKTKRDDAARAARLIIGFYEKQASKS